MTLKIEINGSTFWEEAIPGGNSYARYTVSLPVAGIQNFSMAFVTNSGSAIYLDNIKIEQAVCSDQQSVPQWSGSPTVDNTIYRNGAVAIGTRYPGDYKLAVNGDIKAQKLRVDVNDWADYVFLPDYQLPQLPEIEQFIQENGHLQNIPSAAEVQQEGIDLGEMNKRLLEKVEELTLLMIQMDKEVNTKLLQQIKELKLQNKILEERVKVLEKRE